MNWTKSYLLPLNFCVVSATFSGFISVVHSIKYLCIYPSLQDIVSKHLNKHLAKVNSDLANWTHLPTSFHARISVVKMIILPCVNFYSSMIPLPPPAGCWEKLYSVISQYIWNGKCPRIRLSTFTALQIRCWLVLSKLYTVSLTLRALSAWFKEFFFCHFSPHLNTDMI